MSTSPLGALLATHQGEGLDNSAVAAEHGVQRLALGFSLEGVVLEYGALHDSIMAVARHAGVTVDVASAQAIFDCMITGIAGAVTESARQRDAEVQRQATEHFAFIAHELRNPLSSSLMAFNLLKLKALLPLGERSVTVIERGLGRMHELIEHSLEVARVASGIDLRRETTRVRKLLDDAASDVSVDAELRQIAVALEVEGEDDIEVDARLVSSAMSNLVRNAIKFSHEGSRVSVRAKVRDGRAVFEVEDCCGGLADGTVEAAFAPFSQFSQDQSGFGLGLAIAKQAADAHGGTLRIQNLPGKGCIFVLDIPVQSASRPPG